MLASNTPLIRAFRFLPPSMPLRRAKGRCSDRGWRAVVTRAEPGLHATRPLVFAKRRPANPGRVSLPAELVFGEVACGGGLHFAFLRTVRHMTASLCGGLSDAENDLRTAQFETDWHRQGQYARSAADTAAQVAVDSTTSDADRARAVAVMDTALALAARSLLREAHSTLADARGHADPQRRRELARSAVSKARQVARHRDATEDERAEARQIIGHGRMLATTVGASVRRQQRVEREQEQPDIAI